MRNEHHGWSITELDHVPKTGINVMSTFSCGGGSSMGYKLAGCNVIAANDIDPEMAHHYKLNLKPDNYYLCPIKELLTMDLPQELFGIDILDGSPPCSTFSTSSAKRESLWGKDKHFREGQVKQVLSDLFFDYLDLVDRLNPKIAIAENVSGMLLGNAKGYTRAILRRFKEIGYHPQLFLLNASDCGVPQRRKRVFFCAFRDDLKLKPLVLNPKMEKVSVERALADIELTESEKSDCELDRPTDNLWWPLTRPGEGYHEAVLRMGLPIKLWNHIKIHPKKPSPTLTASDILSHHSEQRRLCLREFKRLGSFPDDYQTENDKIGKYLIGMSVPPRMTEVVAVAICEQWLGVNYENNKEGQDKKKSRAQRESPNQGHGRSIP